MRIVTSLLHANYKENLMTRFSTDEQNRFQRPIYIYSCCHGNGTYVSLTIKKPKCVLLIWLLSFLVTEVSRVLEEKVNETQVSKTVFSHLNWALNNPALELHFQAWLNLYIIFCSPSYMSLLSYLSAVTCTCQWVNSCFCQTLSTISLQLRVNF